MGAEVAKVFASNKEWQKTEIQVNKELEKQRQRYRPESLQNLVNETGFSKREIQLLYRSFKENCPNGIVTKQKFLEIYSDFFFFGDASEYAKLVFDTFDADKNGEINFAVNAYHVMLIISSTEFVQGLSNLWRGSLEEKLTWIFGLYDFDNKGYLTERNMLHVVRTMYEMGGYQFDPLDLNDRTVLHTHEVFLKMDANKDGIITLKEFIECCSEDQIICESMALFRSVLETLHPQAEKMQPIFT